MSAHENNKFRVNKENHDWKEDYITISQEPKREKSKSRN